MAMSLIEAFEVWYITRVEVERKVYKGETSLPPLLLVIERWKGRKRRRHGSRPDDQIYSSLLFWGGRSKQNGENCCPVKWRMSKVLRCRFGQIMTDGRGREAWREAGPESPLPHVHRTCRAQLPHLLDVPEVQTGALLTGVQICGGFTTQAQNSAHESESGEFFYCHEMDFLFMVSRF